MLTDTVRVGIHVPDAVIRAGLASYLQQDRRVREIPSDRMHEADVIVVAVDTVDASALEQLRAVSNRADARFVMVVGKQWQADISTAVDRGVRGVLWRDAFTPPMFLRTLVTVAEGGGSFPPALQGTLMEQVQWTQREVLTPRGLNASGVSAREVDVLRLVAEGEELSEIAVKLSYSERTVKYILYGLMKRMQLRNRAHAVSYAIRSGLI
ncbi:MULTISPECIES: response regulator transcription factor [Streptomycetaceae]|uniref:response regulator transcription factor n=1 Tax=Streptomycetaceae TaxID=2062 RepID=UPI001E624261|nr:MULTISPECIES: response regulator transcription factor [Streptomycetaceae]